MSYLADETQPTGAPARGERAGSRRALGCAFEIVETLVLTLLIYLVIHNFVAQPFEVQQSSMFPTIVDGEYILIDKLTIRFDSYHYGDVVVFEPPSSSGLNTDGIPFIKRIIGLPGDTITLENGRVFVTQPNRSPVRIEEPYIQRDDGTAAVTLPRNVEGTTEWLVPAESYFVMGDNRDSSQDSRAFGPIGEDLILGRAWLRYFPLERIGVLDRPDYPSLVTDDGSGLLQDPGGQPLAGSSATIQASTSRP
ncbi:MAG TPA: signal peptidase I [Methylomirabilota bacterium]|nr:signal peptidase I [Methylomirabilota bacterium]